MIGRPRAFGTGIGQLVHRQPEHLAAAGEGQQRVVRVDQPQLVDEILVLGRRRTAPATAALLRAIGADRLALGVARMRQRDHHVFRRDQVEDVEVFFADARISLRRSSPNSSLTFSQLGADHLQQHVRVLEDLDQAANGVQQHSCIPRSACPAPARSGGAGAFRGSAAAWISVSW
jgi:hypothetical protein